MKSKFHTIGKELIKQGLIYDYEANPDSQIGGMKLKDNNNNILISLDVRMHHLYFWSAYRCSKDNTSGLLSYRMFTN